MWPVSRIVAALLHYDLIVCEPGAALTGAGRLRTSPLDLHPAHPGTAIAYPVYGDDAWASGEVVQYRDPLGLEAHVRMLDLIMR